MNTDIAVNSRPECGLSPHRSHCMQTARVERCPKDDIEKSNSQIQKHDAKALEGINNFECMNGSSEATDNELATRSIADEDFVHGQHELVNASFPNYETITSPFTMHQQTLNSILSQPPWYRSMFGLPPSNQPLVTMQCEPIPGPQSPSDTQLYMFMGFGASS